MGNHDEFLSRIKKTLYYGKFPLTERLSLPVSELAAEIYSEVKLGKSLERLCVEEVADVSRSACVSPCSLIFALFYLERLKTSNPEYVERVSPSELFVISLMVASKFLYDDGEEDEVFNSEWAASAGIDVKEINKYEKDFLKAIDWQVFLKDDKFWDGLRNMEQQVARREGSKRGWFSYTELESLLDSVDAWALAHTLVMVSVVCLTSYTASIMTLYGSAAIASRLPGHHLNPAYRSSLSGVQPQQTSTTNDSIDLNLSIDTCLNENLDCLQNLVTNRTYELSNPTEQRYSWLVSWLEDPIEPVWNSTYYDENFDENFEEIDEFYEDDNRKWLNDFEFKDKHRHSTSWFMDLLNGNLSPVRAPAMTGFPFNLMLTH